MTTISPSNATDSYSLSEIDYQRFGIITAKALIHSTTALIDTYRQCQEDKVKLLILRIPAENLKLVEEVFKKNAKLMDILCYFEYTFAQQFNALPLITNEYQFRLASNNDIFSLQNIVRSIFRNYPNHYHNDIRLSRDAISSVYPSWIETIMKSPNALVFIIENDNIMLGLSAMLPDNTDSYDIALFGIHPQFTNQGLGSILLHHCMHRVWTQGIKQITYSTQLTNLTARRMLAHHGFLPTHDVLTFHLWL